MNINPDTHKIQTHSSFYNLDLRDRLALIISLCERLKIHATKVELAINVYKLEEIKMYAHMGFTICPEISSEYSTSNSILTIYSFFDAKNNGVSLTKSKHRFEKSLLQVTKSGNQFWLDSAYPLRQENPELLNVAFFYKAIEKDFRGISNGDSYNNKNRFCYVSGYQLHRPKLTDVLIGPKWDWMLKTDVLLSGVNFLDQENYLHKKRLKAFDKSFRCIYVGSSSLNKLAPVALFLIVLSRMCLKRSIKPDVFICYRFHGAKGSLIWSVTKLLAALLKFLRFKIIFLLSDKKFNKTVVMQHIEKSMYGLVPYLREGFPRIIGDYSLSDCEPLILSWMKFGGGEFSGFSRSIFSVLSVLRTSHLSESQSVLSKTLPLNFFRPEKRVNKILLEDSRFALLARQMNYVKSEVRYILLYTLLTKDLTLANNFAPRNIK